MTLIATTTHRIIIEPSEVEHPGPKPKGWKARRTWRKARGEYDAKRWRWSVEWWCVRSWNPRADGYSRTPAKARKAARQAMFEYGRELRVEEMHVFECAKDDRPPTPPCPLKAKYIAPPPVDLTRPREVAPFGRKAAVRRPSSSGDSRGTPERKAR